MVHVLCCLILCFNGIAQRKENGSETKTASLPGFLRAYIRQISYKDLGNERAVVGYERISERMTRVTLSWMLKDSLRQDDWKISISPAYKPSFHWAPHLTPTDDHIIAQHVFRSPALIMASRMKQVSIVPDLDVLGKGQPVDWYMDMNALKEEMILGMSLSAVKEHTLFVRRKGAVYPPGKQVFAFYILTEDRTAELFDPWRTLDSFFWKKWGSVLYAKNEPLGRKDMEPYAAYTYHWAFDSWKKSVWQDIGLNGNAMGGDGVYCQRNPKSQLSGQGK